MMNGTVGVVWGDFNAGAVFFVIHMVRSPRISLTVVFLAAPLWGWTKLFLIGL